MYEAVRRGYNVLVPYGDFARYDFVVDRKGNLERVQVKSTTPNDGVLKVPICTMSFNKELDANNRNKQNRYQQDDFDWLAVYDLANHNMYFVPAEEVIGKVQFNMRLVESTMKKDSRMRLAEDYMKW